MEDPVFHESKPLRNLNLDDQLSYENQQYWIQTGRRYTIEQVDDRSWEILESVLNAVIDRVNELERHYRTEEESNGKD